LNLEDFIKTQLDSVEELRALLLFHSDLQREWNIVAIVTELHVPPPMAAAILEKLVTKHFLVADGGPGRYRFQPGTPELSQLVNELAEMDRHKPVTLLNMVYSRTKGVQAFADAFKIKKED
jgi:hypothetical protein